MSVDVLIVFPPVKRFHNFDTLILPIHISPATILNENAISTLVLNTNFVGLMSKYKFLFQRYVKLKNYIRKKWKNLEHNLKKLQPKIVFIGTTIQVFNSLNLTINRIKEITDAKICIYGALSNYSEILFKNNNLDFIIEGESEYTILELSKSILKDNKKFDKIDGLIFKRKNRIIRTPPRKIEMNIDRFPIPDRTLVIDYKKYPRYGLGIVETSRGCLNNCFFCTTSLKKPLRLRSPENIIKEMMELYVKFGVRVFSFYANSITFPKQHSLELFKLIRKKKMNIYFSGYSRTDTLDEEIVKEAKLAGCYMLSIGIESGSQRILNLMNKKNTVEKNKNAIRLLKKHGIGCYSSFIVGYPGETIKDFNKTLDFIYETRPDSFGLLYFLPIKNSLIFNSLVKKNLLKANFEKYNTNQPNLNYNKYYTSYVKKFRSTYNQISERSERIFKLKKEIPKLFYNLIL